MAKRVLRQDSDDRALPTTLTDDEFVNAANGQQEVH